MKHHLSVLYRFLVASAIVLFSWVPRAAKAQALSGQHIIQLKSGIVVPQPNASVWLAAQAKGTAQDLPEQVLIHFSRLPSIAERAVLAANGVTLCDYLPENTYSAIVRKTGSTAALAALPIYGVLDVAPEWKADPVVWSKVAGGKGSFEVLVSFYGSVGVTAIKEQVALLGGQVKHGDMEAYGHYNVILPAAKMRALAQWYGVRHISPVSPIVPLDLQSRPAVKGNVGVAMPADRGYGLNGDSVTVGVGDNGSGIYHADLKDRVVNFNPAPMANHGSHVNGIVGGAAIVDPLSASMAPHVKLVDYLYNLVLPATGAMYRDHNMTITNNSYTVMAGSCDYAGTYDIYAHFLDTLSVQYPDVQHVFASANDGWMNCLPFPQGFATVGGGYQPAKNNIVVGSMTDYLVEAYDESRGPVKDGRLKPEIIAIGLGAYSAIKVDQYEWAAGTSMASPQVAGGLALLTQHYKRMNGGAQPRADFMKPILLNGAMDLGKPGPDFRYGFGAMDVSRSLRILDSGWHARQVVSPGSSHTFTINIPANTAQVKVMLYWNDVPGSPMAGKQLVNDLDLTVTTPSSAIHLPLVPDHTPARVDEPATERVDHLNNVEQVTITNPSAGIYTIKVAGYTVPSGLQPYIVVYDVIPAGVQLTYPLGGEQLSNVDSIRIFWNTISNGNSYTVQYSTNNGAAWTTLSAAVPSSSRYISFMPSGINSGNCLVRILRNTTGEIATSARFTINTQPVVRLATRQCPGYMNIHWSPVPGATAYILHRKIGPQLAVVDTVVDTAYTFSGLPPTEKSYVAVQPIIDGLPGYRSVAAIRQANDGDCTHPASVGDLAVERVVSPRSGRLHTSTALSSSTPFAVAVRTLYPASCNNYTLSYQVNGGTWQQLTDPGTIPPNGTAIINIPGVSFAATGSYVITVAVRNTATPDPQTGNDTLSIRVVHLPNDTISLTAPYTDGFEAVPSMQVLNDSIGVTPDGHWDFSRQGTTGRLRSFVNSDITLTGSRSLSLDADRHTPGGTGNLLTGTFNLKQYDTASAEVRVDFDYVFHGMPDVPAGNFVSARGDDTSVWKGLHTYDRSIYAGIVTKVASLSLTDALRAGGRNFSSSTQIAFGQNDTSLIAAREYGNGLTVDNFRIYTVANDASLADVVSPLATNCGITGPMPITIKVHNGVNYILRNLNVYYRVDNSTVFTGTIDSVGAKKDILYTFTQKVDMLPGTTHTLEAWLEAPGDTYTGNDTLKNYLFRNNPLITSFPYLERFEDGDGGFYAGGQRSSWEYGTPAAVKIKKAASGTKAWKTGINGNYRNLERSYLYSPCFDLSGMSNPMLSFSAAMDVEDCGRVLCDAAWVEYSFDGSTWRKLGTAGAGTNWYDSTHNAWKKQDMTRWHVASIPIPLLGGGQATRFRFVFQADPGVELEGVAIDDIHIYDLKYPVAPRVQVSVTKDLPANTWTDCTGDDKTILAAIRPENTTIPQATVTQYASSDIFNGGMTQYVLPRSFQLQAPGSPSAFAQVRLYIADSDVVHIMADTLCPSCSPVQDAYSLGITQYSNPSNATQENGDLDDDLGGKFSYHPARTIAWVPYDAGYYAELKVRPYSEFWFNDGGPTGTFAANQDYLNFLAYKTDNSVVAYWYAPIDTAVVAYVLQRSGNGKDFADVLDTTSVHGNPGRYSWHDRVAITADTTLLYRLKWTMKDREGEWYSPIRAVNATDLLDGEMFLKARVAGPGLAAISWESSLDGMIGEYLLERSLDGMEYTPIDRRPSLRNYRQHYQYTDKPVAMPATGATVYYRLSALLDNGEKLVSPIKTLIWSNGNSLATVYPNPSANGKFSLLWYAAPGTALQCSVTDITGRELVAASATAAAWENTTLLDLGITAKGVYMARVMIGGNRFVVRIVVE